MPQDDFMSEVDALAGAWEEFFKDKPKPKSGAEEERQLEEFTRWYNAKYDKNRRFGCNTDDEEPEQAIEEAEELVQQGEHHAAIKKLQKVLDIVPDELAALSLMTQACAGVGDVNGARLHLKKLREADPENPEIFMLSAQQDILKGDFDAALKSADAALARDPGYFDALIMKAQLLCWLGDERYRRFISKARKIDKRRTKSFMKNCWMEAAPDRHPAARLGERLARANELVVEGRLEEALAELAAIKKLETEPRIREVIEGISTECLIALKRTDEARRSVRKLLRANPENPHAHLYKAQLELFSNAPEQALGTIDECIRCAQKDKLEHFDYYLVKADILKRLGREYKEWEEKGDRLRQESLQKLKTEAKAAGLECKEQNGFITFE